MFGMQFFEATYSSLWKSYTIKSHWVWAFAWSGSNVSYCKEYREETSLLQRNCLPAQLYMLTFTCMNKSRPRFYYSIPVRHHLWLSKKWNFHRDLRSSKRLRDRSKKSPWEHQRREILLKDSYPETFFCFFQRGGVIIWTTIGGAEKKRNVRKLITAAKNNL